MVHAIAVPPAKKPLKPVERTARKAAPKDKDAAPRTAARRGAAAAGRLQSSHNRSKPRASVAASASPTAIKREPLRAKPRGESQEAAPSTSRRSTKGLESRGASAAAQLVAIAIARAALDKKATGVEIIDVYGRVDYADFIVLMTGRGDRHVHAIAHGIEDELRRQKIRALSVDGLNASTWVLLDFGDVVVHVFTEETRRTYDIEGMWADAGHMDVTEDTVTALNLPGQ